MSTNSRFIKSYFFYIICALGISLTIKGNVGVSSFNAMNLAISTATHFKVGTITTLFNLLFLLGYMIITKFSYKRKYFIQAISVLLFGSLVNFFVYDLFGSLSVNHYLLQLGLIAAGTVIAGLAVGAIVSLNAITFPMESFCMALSEKTKIAFVRLRYSVDFVSITVSVILSLSLSLPFFIREGTLISLILLSSSINFSRTLYDRVYGLSS